MNNTLEQLKTILDNGGTITNGKDEIFRSSPTDEKYSVKGFHANSFWWGGLVWNYLTNPSDWQEVKKEDPDEPKVLTLDLNGTKYICVPVDVYKAQQIELETLRKFVG